MKIFSNILICFAALGLVLVTFFFFLVPLILWIIGLGNIAGGNIDVWKLFQVYIGRTLILSIFSALLAVLLGSSIACLAKFLPLKYSGAITFCMTLPLLIGFIARNYAWLGLLMQFSSSSQHKHILNIIAIYFLDSPLGIVVVMGTIFVPFCYFVAREGFSSLRVEYFEAARTLGATDKRIFFSIVLPIGWNAMILAFILSTILGVGYFITPQLIGEGNRDFIGNGVLTLLNNLGRTREASLLAFYLFITTLLPIILIIVVQGYFKYKRNNITANSLLSRFETENIN